ncbi:hypothetical protein AGDE_08842 [Angomonas deanei]|nr:hypothetical protein AGDE_08842 [Angomonas deanei]|eukprot:EPY32147.1 hypothetical protein AGDE_08842 [Angomonas deanei]
MGGIKGGVGSFFLRRAAAKSVRQRHQTGPQYNKRKVFPRFQAGPVRPNRNSFSNFGGMPLRSASKGKNEKHYHQLHRRDAPGRQVASPTHQPEYTHHAHLTGDVQTIPEKDYTFGVYADKSRYFDIDKEDGSPSRQSDMDMGYQKERADKLMYSWKSRGRLSLHKVQKRETFVCYYCGYPTKSSLMAVVDDNWDYRMCYRCYNNVCRLGLEEHPT